MTDNEEKIKIIEESNRCLNCNNPQCVQHCPLSNNIPLMISRIKESQFEKAYLDIKKTNPLPLICGMICPYEKQCEGSCIRGIKEKPISIGKLESFVANKYFDNLNGVESKKSTAQIIKPKVAIVGGGPAGISCAYFLSRENIPSTIFEKENYLGGILMYGIPDFRLDKEIVKKEIESCIDDNIQVKYNHILVSNAIETKNQYGDKTAITIDGLKKEGYEYIFICIGDEISKSLKIDGIESDKIYGANEFLRMQRENFTSYFSKDFAVVGGGNVAVDSARKAIRLGKSSTIIYRKLEENMPANKSEIKEAKEEGINFIFQNNVTSVKEAGDKIILTLDNHEPIETDFLVLAIGSKINSDSLDEKIIIDENGLIKVDESYETNIQNVFSGGDLIHNKSSVAWALKNGRDVAYTIVNKYKDKQ